MPNFYQELQGYEDELQQPQTRQAIPTQQREGLLKEFTGYEQEMAAQKPTLLHRSLTALGLTDQPQKAILPHEMESYQPKGAMGHLLTDIPGQLAHGFAKTASAGLLPAALEEYSGKKFMWEPKSPAGSIARGVGELTGFLVGAPMQIAKGALGLGAKAIPAAAPYLVGGTEATRLAAIPREALSLGLGGAIGETGEALQQTSVGDAVEKIAKGGLWGAAVGATFGGAKEAFPGGSWGQRLKRIITGMAGLQAVNYAQSGELGLPFTGKRSVWEDVYQTGLDVLFLWHGLPEKVRNEKMKVLEEKVRVLQEAEDSQRAAEIDNRPVEERVQAVQQARQDLMNEFQKGREEAQKIREEQTAAYQRGERQKIPALRERPRVAPEPWRQAAMPYPTGRPQAIPLGPTEARERRRAERIKEEELIKFPKTEPWQRPITEEENAQAIRRNKEISQETRGIGQRGEAPGVEDIYRQGEIKGGQKPKGEVSTQGLEENNIKEIAAKVEQAHNELVFELDTKDYENLSPEDVAKRAGLNKNDIGRYIDYEASGLAEYVNNYTEEWKKKEFVNNAKIQQKRKGLKAEIYKLALEKYENKQKEKIKEAKPESKLGTITRDNKISRAFLNLAGERQAEDVPIEDVARKAGVERKDVEEYLDRHAKGIEDVAYTDEIDRYKKDIKRLPEGGFKKEKYKRLIEQYEKAHGKIKTQLEDVETNARKQLQNAIVFLREKMDLPEAKDLDEIDTAELIERKMRLDSNYEKKFQRGEIAEQEKGYAERMKKEMKALSDMARLVDEGYAEVPPHLKKAIEDYKQFKARKAEVLKLREERIEKEKAEIPETEPYEKGGPRIKTKVWPDGTQFSSETFKDDNGEHTAIYDSMISPKKKFQAISIQAVDKVVEEARQLWPGAPEIIVVDKQSDLKISEENKRSLADKRINGLVTIGTTKKGERRKAILIVAENMDSVNKVRKTLAHEAIGHFGVDTVLDIMGPAGTKFLDDLRKAKLSEIEIIESEGPHYQGNHAGTREWFARQIQEGKHLYGGMKAWWTRFKALVNRAFRKVFGRGGGDWNLTDSEIAEIAMRGRQVVEEPWAVKGLTGKPGEIKPAGEEQFSIGEQVQDTAKAMLDSMKYRKRNKKEWGFWQRIYKTAEYANSPEGKEIHRVGVQGRDEMKHKIAKHIFTLGKKGVDVTKNLTKLREKDISRLAKLKAINLYDVQGADNVSPDYKKASEIMVRLDIDQEKWKDARSRYEKEGISAEVLKEIDQMRKSLDTALYEYQLKPLKEIIDRYEKEGKEIPVIMKNKKTGKKMTLRDLYNEMGQYQGSYFPRIREPGDYQVTYKMPEEKVPYRRHTASLVDAHKLKRELERQGATDIEIADIAKYPEASYEDVKIVDLENVFKEAIKRLEKNEAFDPDMMAAFQHEMLQNAADFLKERGYRAHRLARVGKRGEVVKGYIEDPLTALVLYTNRLAGGLAKAEAGMKMMEALRKIKPNERPEEYTFYKEFIREQLRNPDKIDRLIAIGKSIISFKYLGANPRSLLVNTTALVTTAPAAIHQYAMDGKGAMASVGKEIVKASGDYLKIMTGKEALTDKNEKDFLDELQGSGYDDPQLTRDALESVRKAQGKVWSRIVSASMVPFGATEQFIRGATALAGYRLARQSGFEHAEAVERAKKATLRSHGEYHKGTKPIWAMGHSPSAKLASMGYTFFKFPHNYLQLLGRLGWKHKNYKALAFAIAAPMVLGGTTVMPFKDEIVSLVNALMQATGDNRDIEKMVYDTIRKELGSTSEGIIRHGLLGAFGTDISGSLAIGMTVPNSLLDLAGPFGGIATDISRSWEFMRTGQTGRAIEQLAPTVLSNPLKAFREATKGAVTSEGHRIWDENGQPYMPSGWETAGRVLGLRSKRRAATQEKELEAKREKKAFAERRNRIYKEFRDWLTTPERDQAAMQDMLDEIKKYNDKIIKANLSGIIPFITRTSLRTQVRGMTGPTKSEMLTIKQRQQED